MFQHNMRQIRAPQNKQRSALPATACACLLAGGLLFSQTASAEWLGSTGLGLSYSNNYSLQNGNYSNIQQNRVTRSGVEASAAASWQRFDPNGSISVDMKALADRASDSGNQISNLQLGVSKVLPLSPAWLTRFNARVMRYRDEDYLQNGYNGYSLSATAGYFSPEGDGFDLNIDWRDENHNVDPAASYRTQRMTAGLTWFFAAEPDEALPSVSLALQNHDSDEDRRDARSLLASFSLERIRLGRHVVALSLNWRQDNYDLPYTTFATDPIGPGFGSGFGGGFGSGGMGGFAGSGGTSGATTTSENRIDRQLFASASVMHPLGKSLRGSLSASAGSYDSVTGSQTFFNLYARLRWLLR